MSDVICAQADYFDARMAQTAFDSVETCKKVVSDYKESGGRHYMQVVLANEGGHAVVTDYYGREATKMVVFCSADYLGLAHDPVVKQAAISAVNTHGLTVASVPIIGGTTDIHVALERFIAEYFGYDDAVLFPTGQAANASSIAALCGPGDAIFVDEQVHPSMMEGVHLSRSTSFRFKHNDAKHLCRRLQRCRSSGHAGGILVVTEGTYGLDGEVSDLAEICRTAHAFGAKVYVDDCQGIGIVGPNGRGAVEYCNGLRPDIMMGAFSKAFGSIGGFVAAGRDVVDMLRARSSSSIFSIGISPVFAAAALAGLVVARDNPHRHATLRANIAHAQRRFEDIGAVNVRKSGSAIMSVLVPSEEALDRLAKGLFDAGIWAEVLRHPATRRGEERIRFRIRTNHSLADIDRAVDTLRSVANAQGVAFC